MIQSIKHKGLAELFEKGRTAKLGTQYKKSATFILDHLDYATGPEDCRGVKDFHPLQGDRAGEFSMHVNGNMCITFKWDGQYFYDLDFEDYH